MATSTTSGGGTVTSFGNTPQAKDDFLLASATGLNELTALLSQYVVYLDVMANDLGPVPPEQTVDPAMGQVHR